MKKFLSIILSIFFVVGLTACGNTSSNSLNEEQIRKIIQEEMAKNDVTSEDEFQIGDKLFNPLGNNFKLPINGQENCFATITNIEVTKKKEAEASNLDDYKSVLNFYYFERYLYEVKMEGNVDNDFSGKEINICIRFEKDDEGEIGTAIVKDDGSFSLNFIAYSNTNENVIIPYSVAMN
ncbi:MAG: hypothetical protein U0L72_05275 [Acutalibacteraceae bacterium]|nr:hypothetical protein [Acutalibacteraceae bacterium]